MSQPQQALSVVESPPPKLPNIQSGAAVRAIVPADFDSAFRIANAIVKSGMAPRDIKSPEQAMVIIMHGLEVGLTPMAALQSIANINGRPSVWGDGAIGLVQASGKMEWIKEWYEGEGDNFAAHCHAKRVGDPEIKKNSFSVADAKAAHLWNKEGPWRGYAKRMLKMRARAFTLRDGWADVLRGLSIAEEAQDIPMKDVTPQPQRDAGPPMPAMSLPMPAQPEPVAPDNNGGDHVDLDPPVQRDQRGNVVEATAEKPDGAEFLREFAGALAGCTEGAEVFELRQTMLVPVMQDLGKDVVATAEKMVRDELARVSAEEAVT